MCACAAPVGSYAEAKTTLVYTGADPSTAVIDVSHSRNITIENLRIEAGPGRRFRCGIFFHCTDSAQSGQARLLAPSALNVLSCGIAAGAGAFTVGVRLGDSGERGDLDQNCDHNRLESLWIEGATDEPGGPQAALREGRTGAGVLVAGSQVQGSFFADLHIKRCTAGIFVLDGQLALFGGELAENGGAEGSGPADRGGGDVVFRTGLRAGHLLQDVVSRGSTRFLTSFPEDAESVPPTGQSAAWQGDALIAVTALGCTITGCTDPTRWSCWGTAALTAVAQEPGRQADSDSGTVAAASGSEDAAPDGSAGAGQGTCASGWGWHSVGVGEVSRPARPGPPAPPPALGALAPWLALLRVAARSLRCRTCRSEWAVVVVINATTSAATPG